MGVRGDITEQFRSQQFFGGQAIDYAHSIAVFRVLSTKNLIRGKYLEANKYGSSGFLVAERPVATELPT